MNKERQEELVYFPHKRLIQIISYFVHSYIIMFYAVC